jgi:hypothetical protein
MTLKVDIHGQLVQAARPYSAQNVAIGAASAQSAAFSASTATVGTYAPDGTQFTTTNTTTHVRVVATSACWIAFGSNPVAVASGSSSIYLPAFTPEYFWVNRGEKIAVIQDAASGNLNIAELVA